MPSPFPGMDPFIESRRWRGFQTHLISTLGGYLDPLVAPRYVVDIEDAVYVASDQSDYLKGPYVPDVSIVQQDGWRDKANGHTNVAAVPQLYTLPDVETAEEHYIVLKDADNVSGTMNGPMGEIPWVGKRVKG